MATGWGGPVSYKICFTVLRTFLAPATDFYHNSQPVPQQKNTFFLLNQASIYRYEAEDSNQSVNPSSKKIRQRRHQHSMVFA